MFLSLITFGKRLSMKLFAVVAVTFLALTSFNVEYNQIEICHVPPGNPANRHTIKVSQNALNAHLAHGDFIGKCDGIIVVNPGEGGVDNGGIDPF